MIQGFSMKEVGDLYNSIAPAAFAKFGADPVPFQTAPDGWFTKPEAWDILMEIFGGGNTAVAETGFVSYEDIPTFRGVIEDTARPLYIAVNPFYLPGLYEDELHAVLLHEIAHAAGIWSDQHSEPWRNRAYAFGAAPAQDLFTMRDYTAHPYHTSDVPPQTPTLDLFTVEVPR